jgi:adenylate cyclase
MANERVVRRLAAILAADVVGYSRLMGRDENGTLTRLKTHRTQRLEPTLARHGGRLVKLTGDGALVEFPSAVDALSAAIEFQQAIAEANRGQPEDTRIVFRIGLHLGDLIVEGGDLYGDGVNVAARLEAEAPTGGIVISRTVHEAVADRLKATFDDLGSLTLKNIERPVQAFRVAWHAKDWQPPVTVAVPSIAAVAPLSLPDKPSIAVLAFHNMSGDPEQEYFADGIAEDIITELSRFKSLFVIARNSSFTYKGRAVDVKQVGRELGVRYVLEGSVRCSGPRVRVSAQLIDAFSGEHIWSERYDLTAGDIFAVQDELTRKIVAVLPGRVESAEQAHAGRKTSQSLEAHDLLLRAKFLHHFENPDAKLEAQACLDRAIEKDPTFAAALAWKACTLGQAWKREFQPRDPKREVEINRLVRRAIELDDNDAECHRIMCRISLLQRQYEKSEYHLGRALELTPNDPRLVVQRGINSTYLGEARAALPWIEQAMRIDPFSASHYETDWVRALYASGRPGEANAVLQRSVRNDYVHHLWLATCSVEVGQEEQARKEVRKALAMQPALTISSVLAYEPWKKSEDAERIQAALLRASLPLGGPASSWALAGADELEP